jgi:hypothetical protein
MNYGQSQPGRPLTRRLNAVEFKQVLPLLANMAEHRVAMARAAMVGGRGLSDVARDFECTPQNVDGAVSIIWEKHQLVQQLLNTKK